jgi:hypothetical protein
MLMFKKIKPYTLCGNIIILDRSLEKIKLALKTALSLLF